MPESRSSFRFSIAQNTTAQLIGRVVSSFATFMLTLLIARTFGSDGYGDFVKITTFVSFFYLLADFGFNAIYIQRSATVQKNNIIIHDTHWSLLFFTRLIVSSILCITSLLILYVLPTNLREGYSPLVRLGILMMIPTILFQSLITTANGLFQKKLRYDLAAYAVVIGALFSLMSLGILIWMRTDSLFLYSVIPVFIGSAVTATVSFLFIKNIKISITFHHTFSSYISFFLATMPLGLTLLFNVVYFHIDSIVLTFSRPTAEVGVYGLAYKVFELILVLPTFFMNAMYPSLVQAASISKDVTYSVFKKLTLKATYLLFFGSLILMISVWFGSPLLAHIKSDFIYSVTALRVLSLSLPLFFLSSLTMWMLIALKKQWALVSIYGASMVINIMLNVVYVPQYGYMAAAWITIVSECIVLLCSAVVLTAILRKAK